MIDWKNQCAAVIPCFNEATRIGEVVVHVKKYLTHVIVIDDGSTDETAMCARTAGAEVIQLTKNGGKGVALKAGWRRACEHGHSWVVMLDGDGQHAAADLPNFFHRAETAGADLVVGNRMNDCAAMPWLRRQVNRWMSRQISRMTGVILPDSQCGFRLMNLERLPELVIRANHFEIESALLVAFCRAGCKVEFVPVKTIYRCGTSKIHPITDTIRWFRWLYRRESTPPPQLPARLKAPSVANGNAGV